MGSFAKARYEFKFLKASNAFAKDRFANQPFVAAVLARAIQGCRRRYKSGRGLRACRPRFALSWPSRILSGRGAKSHSGFGGVTLITSHPFIGVTIASIANLASTTFPAPRLSTPKPALLSKSLKHKDFPVERVKGIEPSYSAWKAAALPLSYTRVASL